MQVRIFDIIHGLSLSLLEEGSTISLPLSLTLEYDEYVVATSSGPLYIKLINERAVVAIKWGVTIVDPESTYFVFHHNESVYTFLIQSGEKQWVPVISTGRYIPEEVLNVIDSDMGNNLLSPNPLIRGSAEYIIKND